MFGWRTSREATVTYPVPFTTLRVLKLVTHDGHVQVSLVVCLPNLVHRKRCQKAMDEAWETCVYATMRGENIHAMHCWAQLYFLGVRTQEVLKFVQVSPVMVLAGCHAESP